MISSKGLKLKNMKKAVYISSIILLVIASLVWNTWSYRNGSFSMYDTSIFMEQPSIVYQGDEYFIEFRYAEHTSLFMIETRIESDKLILYLPVTTSTGNPAGTFSKEKISGEKEIELIKNGQVYWEEPNGVLIQMSIEARE